MNTKLFVFSLFSLFALVFSLPIVIRDVYVPPILTPKAGDVWVIGEKRTVTWDTSNPPQSITNKIGEIYLREGDTTFLDSPLAQGFDILLGTMEVTVPNVTPGNDYMIVLMGDSGNWSPPFSIVSASS
ncbi:hypothetical protein M378DRAFT_75513 [Amanita muscaria Koide BX008]|uniref:Yeast cell wall synthesis Kre9/Knh1-like N-terminal domain-containing protein n=1 Tax=Amanita muscaria (strain Koide BX008) TaxID=946122 RepID=A0A0C2WWN8_AMAMK|nr:hypothetical protein M378DRAFT_75513 [Amanita muscaria Koide BX008]